MCFLNHFDILKTQSYFYSIGNFSELSYRTKTLRGMRTAAYKVDVAVRPPQARVSQAKLFVLLYFMAELLLLSADFFNQLNDGTDRVMLA